MADYAQATQLQIGDGAGPPEGFTLIAEVLDIKGPSLSREQVETTSHDTADGYMTFIPGLADGGEVSFDIQYMMGAATHAETGDGIARIALDAVVRLYQIVPPVGGKKWNFSGFITKFEPGFPVGDKQTASITVKISGKPTVN
jgi:hypothetical protein